MSDMSITIKVEGEGNSGGQNNSIGQTTETEELVQGSSESTFGTLKKAVAATGVVAMGTKTLNYISTRVYPETGNRQLQDEINATKQVAGQVLSIIGAGVAGGPIGALAAAGVVALDYAFQASTYSYNRSMENTILNIQRERMGVGGMALSRSRAQNQ